MDYQQTVKNPVSFSGISLMLGVQSSLTVKPAPTNYGIVFVRTDLPQRPQVKVDIANHVSEIARCTSIRDGEACVHSIEHVLSALAGMRIDNAIVEIDAPETPAADGSALPYIEVLKQADVSKQDAPRQYFQITQATSVSEADKHITMLPAEQFQITFAFDHPNLSTQLASFTIDESTYIEQIAPARTFCFANEVEFLRSQGLGRGASRDNVIVISDEGTPDSDLRFQNEMVRHKILDIIGDLYLLGGIPKAHLTAIRSGHALNMQLVKNIEEGKRARGQEGNFPLNLQSSIFNLQSKAPPIEAVEIYKVLEHRYPFQMVDRIIEIEEGKRGVGIKNVTFNELFFQGHFPGRPIMPAVLQLEALAQTAGYLIKRLPEHRASLGLFAGMDRVKFRNPVVPGDQLRLEVEIITVRKRFVKTKGKATVNGETTAEAEMTFYLGG
ncbi:UDP-3-O-[3-hydroxymyristoyl] N-acetylglucosamine deacetylase [Candidatus Poribacteria bacterium]|nr:UDP-3-O-[3-hydroxymyristoyl] N-acetylglucosamine deacetylase [Candidatus Poribacteria bacterium]